MITILPSSTFLAKGAVVFEGNELTTMILALIVERDRIVRVHGDRCGLLSIEELNGFIEELRKYQKERGA